MSLEAITEIRAVEERAERVKAEARAQARSLREAEEAAAARREAILAQAAADCRTLRDAAHGRMEQAVRAILERVVES